MDSLQWAKVVEIKQLNSGEIVVPQLPFSRMTPLLFSMKPEISHDASMLLDRLPNSVTVTAVVELKRPLAVDEVKKINRLVSVDILLSPLRPMAGSGNDKWKSKPFYWPNTITCEERDRPKCDDNDPFSQFRDWVAGLKETDSPILKEFGLDLSRLRTAARQGLVYGWIAHGQPKVARLDMTGPHVKDARIAEITPIDDEDQIVEPLPRHY
ncbi:hypothetical protein ACFY05_21670 [Microtetraspora fusca]|uniref:Uncharacterized protein n=1 Tax=Microtetraspora fusca TaxID=1997 RepID=A0ABW6V830_MICFU